MMTSSRRERLAHGVMRRITAEPPEGPQVLADERAAGAELRRSARRSMVLGGLLMVPIIVAAEATYRAFAQAGSGVRTPGPLAEGLVMVFAWLVACALIVHRFRNVADDARRLRPGTVVAAPRPGVVAVRGGWGMAWRWAYRRRFGMRVLEPGERVWMTTGSPGDPPHLIVARPVVRAEHVLWGRGGTSVERVTIAGIDDTDQVEDVAESEDPPER